MTKGPLDTLIAFKIICLSEDLSPTGRRVAAALIEHFNRRTGRCDPSHARIAALLGVDRSTVIRAINSLAKKGYLVRKRHGGFNHRNSYVPCWTFFRAKQDVWRSRWQAVSHNRGVSPSPPYQEQVRHVGNCTPATQTSSNNITKKTSQNTPGSVSKSASNNPHPRAVDLNPTKGFNSDIPVSYRMPRVTTPRSAEAAIDSAERRWTTELTQLLAANQRLFAEVLEALTEEMKSEATYSELKRPGSGLRLILQRLEHLFSDPNGQAK